MEGYVVWWNGIGASLLVGDIEIRLVNEHAHQPVFRLELLGQNICHYDSLRIFSSTMCTVCKTADCSPEIDLIFVLYASNQCALANCANRIPQDV